MSARRDEILQGLGLWPAWRLRGNTGGAPREAPDSASAGDPPVSPSLQGDRGDALPHLEAAGGHYYVTLRLADSLPAAVLGQLEQAAAKPGSRKTEEALDAAHGECWLAQPEIADMVKQALLKFHGKQYRLHAWVIMPNHVHLLMEPIASNALAGILDAMKSASADAANRLSGRDGEFWAPADYARLLRDDSDRARCVEYIVQNPVKAGLARTAGEFRWSSAHREPQHGDELPALRQHTGAVETIAAPVLPLDARAAQIAGMDWEQLRASVAGCTACPLHSGRNKTVFGVGDEHADWLFVGEGPGAEEDAKGEPFVGQAGKLLDNMLAAIELKRGKNVYIANVVKCRPPGNRNPEALEARQCEAYLRRQIELLQPKLIVALGKVAAVNLLKRDAPVASLRGKVLDYEGTPLIITYHPAYLLRTLHDKAKAWDDLCFAVATMRRLQSAQPAPI